MKWFMKSYQDFNFKINWGFSKIMRKGSIGNYYHVLFYNRLTSEKPFLDQQQSVVPCEN